MRLLTSTPSPAARSYQTSKRHASNEPSTRIGALCDDPRLQSGSQRSRAANGDMAHRDLPSSPNNNMAAHVGHPLDPPQNFLSPDAFTLSPLGTFGTAGPQKPSASPGAIAAARAASRSPARPGLRSVSNPVTGAHAASSVRANPVVLASRQPGSVKDIANRFNQGATTLEPPPQLTVRTSEERYRRAPGGRSAPARSPTTGRSETEMARKLQKRRPGQSKSPQKSPVTSFETSSSKSSSATAISARSQSHASITRVNGAVKPAVQVITKPLFGELTADGWHGNFDLPNYGTLPSFRPATRRQSDGSIALGHGRTQSHQNMQSPTISSMKQSLHHKRSRSEMDAYRPQAAPSMPNLHTQHVPILYPTPPNSGTRNVPPSPTSRIPISSRRQSEDSGRPTGPYSRSASAMSNTTGRNRLSKSPTRVKQDGKENTTPLATPRNRYQPPPISTSTSSQMLSAKIVAPPAKTSPSLRSSRPRQPVSSATTSASRARAADRFASPTARDGRRPSEQWLGKPYDAQVERTRRKIPELGKVDFAERRARIQKAISQNIERTDSQASSRSRSRSTSYSLGTQAEADAEDGVRNSVDRHQADEMNRETDELLAAPPVSLEGRLRGLSIDTVAIPEHAALAFQPLTANTDFEVDESPTLGRPAAEAPKKRLVAEPEAVTDSDTQPPKEQQTLSPELDSERQHSQDTLPVLLSSATYQPHAGRPVTPPPSAQRAHDADAPSNQTPEDGPMRDVSSPSILDHVMRMREQSPSTASRDGTEFADDSPSAEDSPSDLEERWGLNHHSGGEQGVIGIMLDDDPTSTTVPEHWPKSPSFEHAEGTHVSEKALAHQTNEQAFPTNESAWVESPVNHDDDSSQQRLSQATPRKAEARDDTLKPSFFIPAPVFKGASGSLAQDDQISKALDQYQTTGSITPEMLQALQSHEVDLNRVSANGGSDAIMVQNLLDSMLDARAPAPADLPKEAESAPVKHDTPALTPDAPSDEGVATGTAQVFGAREAEPKAAQTQDVAEEDDFHAVIRRADEEWERRQRGEEAVLGAADDSRPPPPPKDYGYTPRSSMGPPSATFPPNLADGLRMSVSGDMILPGIHQGDLFGSPSLRALTPPPASTAPPLPSHAPPPPPSPLGVASLDIPDVPPIPASYSERGSNELSPRVRRNLWGPTGSSRPSTDSQRAPVLPMLPGSHSFSSFADSTRHNSIDAGADSMAKLANTISPGPEQKRLMKRRHIIKELLDTEINYHQDVKIIEDIYKATVADLVSAEDKKTLFGNCDEIERFSLHFYDELRRAVSTVYVPPKGVRWGNKRNSHSTTHSDATGQTSVLSTDSVDEEKDRSTTIGQCFLKNLPRMDQVYGAYLKNHDAANQRLALLKNTLTVKLWLVECHNNASDITSAWDLDSLLVKPTQRVSKYPMLLQQLLETTPSDHPDYEPLKAAGKESINMLTRINEAKKRADIVDHIINNKGKDTDVRSGIAKAFGRRTEKLKERVGIAEAFQDQEFDELSHKFGGHYIRLQICMRDVQDYLHRIDKAMDQINNCAGSLELYTDVSASSLPEIESKWRRYGQVIREISAVTFPEHKAAISKRVIAPMLACIKLHEGPQNAIAKRKKRIIDYAKCKSIEKRGEKPDKKTLEASEMYVALNDQLKIELPQLYTLTAGLVQACLNCFLDVQLSWYNMWERKLGPILEAADIPTSIQSIEPAFRPDYDLVKHRLTELSVCNGSLLADSANFLSPTSTLVADPEERSLKRPSTLDSSKRTSSMSSDSLGITKRYSQSYAVGYDIPPISYETRMRSNSSLSNRGTAPSQSINHAAVMSANRGRPSLSTPTSSFSASRPSTATAMQSHFGQRVRDSTDQLISPRPSSATTYFTTRHDPAEPQQYNSALPPDNWDSARTSPRPSVDNKPVLFVCASLFEFSIDQSRKENGYPYLTYVQGEVFDVVEQKGELWLAKNQDDGAGHLGWIWEQRFVILSQGA